MSNADWLWPVNGKSFYDRNDSSYLVHIGWGRNVKDDYWKLSKELFECGYKVCEKIVDSGHEIVPGERLSSVDDRSRRLFLDF